ncbi:MAG: hypothetical protein CMO01_13865 [Thalassobius sp.]|nr:hypothetical protein [Thalassovita sp.]
MKEDAITQKIANKLKAWKASQKGQTDFYEYEKSFVETWLKLGKEVLQDGLDNGNYKKNTKKK